MKNSNWTPEQVAILQDPKVSHSEAAARTQRTEAAVRGKRQRLGVVQAPKVEAPKPPATFEQDEERHAANYWQREYKTLEGKYEKALRSKTAVDQLVEKATILAPKSYDPAPEIRTLTRSSGSPQSAVLLLTDCHVGLVVKPEQTLGFGHYNFPMFLARLKYLEEACVSIMRDHTTTPIPELVICLGGDMLDGALHHSAESSQKNTVFTQFYGAGHALAQFIRNISAYVPKIRIYCTQGNHTRFQDQKRMPTNNRFSSFDSFLYAYIQALTGDIGNVNWNFDQQPVALFDVQGFLFQLLHGDVLRGGDKALGVPNHSVGRLVSSGSQMFGKLGQRSPDFYLCGHLHREIVLPTSKGAFIVGGGFPGMDGYGLASGFTPVDPSQTFFFVHPRYGKTATYSISLKHAKIGDVPPYEVPGEFPSE